MVPEELHPFFQMAGVPDEVEMINRGQIHVNSGQFIVDTIQRYTTMYLDIPEVRKANPKLELSHQQRMALVGWLKVVSPNGIVEYRNRCRVEDFMLRQPKKDSMERKFKRLFPEAYKAIFLEG